jgi:acyl-CoA synthetase (AMP-forming)/AMP-acid ligase II
MKPDLSGLNPLHVNLATRVCVGDALGRSAVMFADRAAVIDRGTSVSYDRLDSTAEALAASLLRLGCERQSPVTMLMGNSWRFLATYFACAKSGLVAMPVNVLLTPSDIEWIISDSGSRTIIVDDAFVALLERLLPGLAGVDTVIVVGDGAATPINAREVSSWADLTADLAGAPVEVVVEDRDALQCLYTSGTTSRPKGVLVSHVSVLIAGMTNALMMEYRAVGNAQRPAPVPHHRAEHALPAGALHRWDGGPARSVRAPGRARRGGARAGDAHDDAARDVGGARRRAGSRGP